MSGKTLLEQVSGQESLKHLVEITVPGTRDRTVPLDETEHKEVVDRTAQFLTDLFGGASAIPARGWFTSSTKEVIPTLVYAFAGEMTRASLTSVVYFAKTLRQEYGQECVTVRVDNEAVFI